MSKTTTILTLLLGLLLAFDASAQAVGFVASVHGSVEIRAESEASWTAANLDRDVHIGDTVRTGADAGIKILLQDDTTLTIGPETELRVDSFVVGAAATPQRSVLELVRGRVRAWIGELFGAPSRVEMHTPTAVIGVKGTAYDVWVLERESGVLTVVCVTHGAILVRPPGTPPGSAQEVSLGDCVQIGRDGVVRPSEGPPPRADGGTLAGEPATDDLLVGDLRAPEYQKLSTLERFLLAPPPVGLSPTGELGAADGAPTTGLLTSLEPRQAPQDPILDGEDPLYRHDWYENPILGLSLRNHIPIVPDPEGGGSNLQIYRFVPFYNFDYKRPDVRIFVR